MGSLRQALIDANTTAGADNITFNIPGTGVQRIQPLTPLPYIDDPVTIDGSTQPGYAGTPLIEVSGTNVANDSGLVVRVRSSKIRALSIINFGHDGITVLGDASFNNSIEANFIGIDASGTLAQGNGTATGTQYGVRVTGGAGGNVIQDNLISGNLDGGIAIEGGGSNKIQNNKIGTDVTGSARVPNNLQGILVTNSASSTLIDTNLISGNDGDGIHLFNSGDGLIFGNVIGTNQACDQSLENRGVGVYLTDTDGVTANTIIGNKFTGGGNLISGNFRDGIRIEGLGVSSTLIQGNRIGTDGAGTSIIANGDGGVAIINSANHQVGGPDLSTFRTRSAKGGPGRATTNSTLPTSPLGVANLLSGNADDGVFIFGPDSTNNLVSENLVGTTVTGKAPLANNQTGITIRGAVGNTVSFNTVSGNNVAEVRLQESAESNNVTNNFIGTDPDGSAQVGGAGPGVLLETGTTDTTVRRNVISGNLSDGVVLRSGATANIIRVNRIGIDSSAVTAIPNTGNGIRVESSGNEIGGGDGEGNVISGNRENGILFTTNGATGNAVVGNRIGTNGYGDNAVPNQGHGVSITAGATNNTVGTSNFTGNLIAFNTMTGVSVTSGVGNTIRGNQLRANGRLGIDLNEDAVTFNDPGDADSGPNGLQNFPVITDVSSDGSSTTVTGFLNSLPSQSYELDFYANSSPDSSGHGEAEYSLTSATVTTDTGGHADFSVTVDGGIAAGTAVSATATDTNGSTSEFSANFGFGVDLTPPDIQNCQVTPRSLPGNGGTVTFSADVTDNTAVASVSAFVTRPDNSVVEVVLAQQGTSNTWSGTLNVPGNTGSAPQQYGVKLQAFDNSNNRTALDCGTFTVAVVDNTPPAITNCVVNPRSLPSSGGYVTFKADITDASGVAMARVVVTNPNNTETNVPLVAPEVGNTYQFTYMVQGNSGSTDLTYGVRFEATDTVSNMAVEPCGTFVVSPPDRTGPTFANCQLTPRSLPASGGSVLISADITDPSGVETATAFITFPDTSVAQVPLARQGNSDTFQGTFNAPQNSTANVQTYAVKIGATDTLRNGSSGDCGNFTVGGIDGTPPVITNCQLTPTVLQPAGGSVTIGADVTDNFGVRSVQGRVSRPDGTVAVVPLTLGSANHYSGTFTAPANTGTTDLTYTVFVVASDGSNNTTIMRCGTFVVLAPDIQAPSIKGCQVQPRRLPSPGGDFTITATVTDNRSVATVVAKVTGPSGGTVVPLTLTGNNYTGTFTAPQNLSAQDANYQVTLEAADPSGNQSTADCGTITVLKPDTEPPAIVRCDVSPRTLLAPGGPVTLTADVTDNAGVDRIEVAIVGSGEYTATVTLALKSGNTYEGTWNAPANDTASAQNYGVTFRAFDTSENLTTSDCGTVTVATPDNQAPVISACQVTPRALLARGGTVTITATVTDDVAVNSVRAVITRPDGVQVPVALASQGGNNYQGTYAVSPNAGATAQSYQVEIRALDNSGNQATVDCGAVTVAVPDTTAPVLLNCAIAPRALPASGGSVAVTADATDNVSVQSVVAEIQRPDGTIVTAQLTSTGGSGYRGTIDLPANDTNATLTYLVRLVATDSTGNRTTQDCGAVTVAAVDRLAPSIANCSVSPGTLPFSGGTVQVQASVTDNEGVASVVARILRGGVLIDTVTLTAGTPPSYSANFAALPNLTGAAQEYTIELVATDTTGNSRSVECGTYTVEVDTVPPALVACDATPRTLGSEGGLVTFTATVTDSIPVDHVVVRVVRPDGTIVRVVLNAIGQDQFRGTWTAPANNGSAAKTYEIVVEAADVAGNERLTDCGEVTVALASGGSAQVSATQIPFGRVRFGTRVRRQFVIRNVSGGSRLAVNLSTLNLPFTVRLEGAGLDGSTSPSGVNKTTAVADAPPGTSSSFSIAPGGIVTVIVEFAPPVIRSYSDRLLITTSDPRHPEFRVRITGVGCKNGRRGTPIGTGDGGQGGASPVAHKKH